MRVADLNSVWEEFQRIYPCGEISISELKTHFLCLDTSINRWELEEDVYLYFKYGSHVEEMDVKGPESEEQHMESSTIPTMFITFAGDRKENLNYGPSLDTLHLCKEAFLNDRNDQVDLANKASTPLTGKGSACQF